MNKTLQNAVIRRIGGKEALKDVMNHGADAGYPGFTYYTDTISFFKRHKAAIVEMASEMADDMGTDTTMDLIKSFRCLNNDFTAEEIAQVIYGPWKDDDAHTMIANAMAWFALEEVARYIWDK